jgi:serine/threonine-protein kinase
MVGKTLGRYRILEKIGAGGMGEVYRGHDERLERDVAIKVLPQGLLADEAARKRFHKEALSLSRLNHPNIATVHDFDTHSGTDFLVMEYVPGVTLDQKVAKGPLPEREFLRLGMQLAEGLAAAHEQGVVHQDLKPGNLRVTPDGRLKILDFGLAKLVRPEASSEAAVTRSLSESQAGITGTLPYMAPEQLRREPSDARSDIYAAGAVLYELATGRRAFRETLAPRLIDAILHKPPEPPSALNRQVPSRLEEIILKCLEKDPENRYQSVKEVMIDLRRLTAPVPLEVVPIRKQVRTRVTIAAAALLVAVLVTGAYIARYHLWPRAKPPVGRIKLAVLPFENMSGNPEQEFFCDGLTEEMISQLGRLEPRHLGVIARASVMRYRGSKQRIDEVGHELGVDYILEGGVALEGQRARINAQLIQVSDQTVLWTESYLRNLADLFAVQSEVTRRIARSLALELLPQNQVALARAPTTVPDVYEAYLKGRYHWNKGSQEQLQKARQYFEQAVALDPKFAPGYAGLADSFWASAELRPRIRVLKAKEYVLKALELDPMLADARTSLGNIRLFGDWDWEAAGEQFKRALELNPNDAEAHRSYSVYLSTLGRSAEALTEVRRAQELDPFSLLTNVTFGWTFYFARQYGPAIEQCHKALELDTDSVGAHDCLGQSYRARGMREEAIAQSNAAVTLSRGEPDYAAGLASVYAEAGRTDDAEKILLELRQQVHHRYVAPYLLASIYASLNQPSRAFASLENAYTEHDPYLAWLMVDPALDPLRSDPRFQDFLRRIGFAQ